ncbi:helix-turn-helix domain-containing protein [Veillonella sp.]
MTFDIVCSEAQSEKAIQHLGVLILLWRRHFQMTQQELARRTGLLQSYISGLEQGNIDPRISTLCRVVNGFDHMTLDAFFAGPDVGFIDFHVIEQRHMEFH